ncbi:uncharacterized protein LOC134276460 [Saccostrea cucullata]|uniref:uncharacterized protein LOC134276460 n=1 Tax=Saccostrea cuccullata TaxID=36930 RepID=UPI002ED50BF8
MPMERNKTMVYLWIFLTTLFCWIVKCGKLSGYSFPVYATLSCPRNQSEWRNRSSDLNCTESNGYMCIPNENITQLLEFCYRYPKIPVEKSICLILKKSTFLVDAYSCKQFRNGCPNKLYWSDEVFKYQSCLSIGNRCFLAEPLCTEKRIATIGPTETKGDVRAGDVNENNSWVWILVTGVFLLFLLIAICVLVIIRGGKQKTSVVAKTQNGEDDIPSRRHSLRERDIDNMEETPFIKYEDEEREMEDKQDEDAEIALLSANKKTLEKENISSDRYSNEINREKFEEELTERDSDDKSLSDCIIEKQDDQLCLEETSKTADSSSEDISIEKYSLLNKDVSDEIDSYSKQKENIDKISSEKLETDRDFFCLDKINREKTEEEGGDSKSNDESLKTDIAERHDNTLHLDETNETTDLSSESYSEKENLPLAEEVQEWRIRYAEQQEKSDRISSEELDKVGIYLDDYEIWKTEISGKYKELSDEERAVLFLLLCSNKNSFILEKPKTLTKRVSGMIGTLDVSKSITESIQTLQSKGLVSIQNEKVEFASDDVHDETMFDYVHTCWKRSKVYVQQKYKITNLFENIDNQIFRKFRYFF